MTPMSTHEPTSNLFNLTNIFPYALPTSAKHGQSIYLSPVFRTLSETLYKC